MIINLKKNNTMVEICSPDNITFTKKKVPLDEIDKLIVEIHEKLNEQLNLKITHRNRNVGGQIEEVIKNLGKKLYNCLFSKSNFDDVNNVNDLIFNIDKHLIFIPVEILYDGERFLALEYKIAKNILPDLGKNFVSLDKNKNAVILANPTSDENLSDIIENEAHNIYSALNEYKYEPLNRKVNVKPPVYGKRVTKDFLKTLYDCNIIYYSGHSKMNANGAQTGLILQEGVAGYDEFQDVDLPKCELIYLNSCESLYSENGLDKNLINVFHNKGVNNIVGNILRVPNKYSAETGMKIFEFLSKDKTLGEAIKLTRNYIVNEYGVSELSWLSLTHYGNINWELVNKITKVESNPIAKALMFFENETDSYKKLLRLRDLYETIIKYFAVVLLCDYANHNAFISKQALASKIFNTISNPNIFNWRDYISQIIKQFEEQNIEFFMPEIKTFYNKALINFNTHNEFLKYTEIAGSSIPGYEKAIENLYAKIQKLLNEADFLKNYPLALKKNNAYCLIDKDGKTLSLSPLLIKTKDSDFSFYNGFEYTVFNEIGGIDFLDYSKGLSSIDKYKREFEKIFPLDEWRRNNHEIFHDYILNKTENFVGRRSEILDILQFIGKNTNGAYVLYGNPGYGKSAIAGEIALLKSGISENTDNYAENFLRDTHVIHYFVEKDKLSSQAGYYLDYLYDEITKIYNTGIAPSDNLDTKYNNIKNMLNIVSEEYLIKNDRKLLIVIDGLDEADQGLLMNLIDNPVKNVFYLFTSRAYDDIKKRLSGLRDMRNYKEGELCGLTLKIHEA